MRVSFIAHTLIQMFQGIKIFYFVRYFQLVAHVTQLIPLPLKMLCDSGEPESSAYGGSRPAPPRTVASASSEGALDSSGSSSSESGGGGSEDDEESQAGPAMRGATLQGQPASAALPRSVPPSIISRGGI